MINNISVTKKKVLAIVSRLPSSLENTKDARLFNMLRYFCTNNDVHLLYIQSSDSDLVTKKEFEKYKIEILSIKEKRKPGVYSFELQFKELISSGKYDLIFLNSYYSAKYYLPYIEACLPDTVIVIDAANSQLFSANSSEKVLQVATNPYLETTKFQEASVFSHADVVVVEQEKGFEEMMDILPDMNIVVVNNDEIILQSGNTRLDNLVKRPKRRLCEIETDVVFIRDNRLIGEAAIEEKNRNALTGGYRINISETGGSSSVEGLNNILKSAKGEYTLLIAHGTIINDITLAGLLYCAQVNPKNVIIVPASNYSINCSLSLDHYEEFVEKHYKANFGYWRLSKCIAEKCLLIKNDLFSKIGLLDQRYRTIEYACMDFSIRAFQAGFKSIVVNESFVYRTVSNELPKEVANVDKKLLYDKWGNDSTEFLEVMGEYSK